MASVKVLRDVDILLPSLTEKVKTFITTLTTAVDELVTYFDKMSLDETLRAFFQELLKTMIYSDSYMDKVDIFASNARHKPRQDKVIESLKQESPQLQPTNDYISQLRNSLAQAQVSPTISEQFDGNLRSLEGVLIACRVKLVSSKTTDAMLGAALGSAIGMEFLMAIPKCCVAVKVAVLTVLTLSGVAVGTGIGAVTAGATGGQDRLEHAIPVLETLVPSIMKLSNSIQLTISELCLKLDSISELAIDEDDSNSRDVLITSLNSLFEKLKEFGNTCLVSQQELRKKKDLLQKTIDKLLES